MEIVRLNHQDYGVAVYDFDTSEQNAENFQALMQCIYREKIVILKNQSLSTQEFVALGSQLGTPEAYYQPMYHHPDNDLIFVSSNINQDGLQVGVPKTGKFWHGDYSFMDKPFALTMIYPQRVPRVNRGTYFIDMADAYKKLTPSLREIVDNVYACHSVRKYFKVRPSDVYRPLSEVIDEVEKETPEVIHPAVFLHPVTKVPILYVSEGFTQSLVDKQGRVLDDDILQEIFTLSGQLDPEYQDELIHFQTFEKGDVLLWDNRRLIHRALHTQSSEPSVSYRLTLHDQFPFYEKSA